MILAKGKKNELLLKIQLNYHLLKRVLSNVKVQSHYFGDFFLGYSIHLCECVCLS